MNRDISKEIVKFAIMTDHNALATSAREVMKLSWLDWVAATLAGRDEPVSRIVREMVAKESREGPCSVAGLTQKLGPQAAALANGATSHALDYDDTHFIYLGHPSTVVLSAALAVAEAEGASVSELLDAALIGVELACRIGAWIGDAHYRKGFHITATAGTFGAAMAAARLMKLTEDQALTALSIAASRAAGVRAQFGTMGKPYHAGMAASSGVQAAQLAASGFIAADRGMDAPQGFAETHDALADQTAFDELGTDYVFETVQHKFHACCHGLHATLEALAELKTTHAPDMKDIESINITVQPRYLTVCNQQSPRTGLEAKFSYRLTTAMALLGHDTAGLDTYTDAICTDPTLVEIRNKVFVQTEDGMSGTVAKVVIKMKNGQELFCAHDLSDLPAIEVRRKKVQAKAASLLGADDADYLWKMINAEQGNATLFT